MIFLHQVCMYIADHEIPWEYIWIEFDGLRVKEAIELAGLKPEQPVYKARYTSWSRQQSAGILSQRSHLFY